MSDDNNRPPRQPTLAENAVAPAPQPQPRTQFGPLPEGVQIPAGMIEQWLAVPWNHLVEPRLARQEWEFLFFGLTKMTQAQQHTNDCVVKWSNGDTESANAAMDASRRLTIEADNQFRQFFMALIASALRK